MKSDRNIAVNSRDLLGQTPLHYAAMSGSDEVVLELLAHGADIDLQDDLGETALNRVSSLDSNRREDWHSWITRAYASWYHSFD